MSKQSHSAKEHILVFAGGISGIVECLTVQPFDMLKTRFQLNDQGKNQKILSALKNVYQEGGIMRFYRGILPEALSMFPKQSGMFTSYELSRRIFAENYEKEKPTWKSAFAAGFVSGYVEAFIVTPFQVVKVRLQAKEYLGKYNNSIDCVNQILRQEGIKKMFIGFGPTIWRNCVWNSVFFGLMFKLKDYNPQNQGHVGNILYSFMSGTLGGMFATCFNAPFDCVKSRFQRQIHDSTNTQLKYRYTLQSLFQIYKEEGASAIYKGFAPKLIRMGLGGGVSVVTYELICLFANTLDN